MIMDKLELPIGDASFRNIRTSGCYYVDKTPHLWNLTKGGGRYWFLSRPRRFGKSLLLDTLHELFAGSKELFEGLYIHGLWDWSVEHPVVRLSFDGSYSEPGELEKDILEQLESTESQYGLAPAVKSDTGARRLRNVIGRLYHETDQQVVVLVDEYDKPILDALENRQQAEANRDYLRGFYGAIKGCARYIRFVFVTGISMYSKVSLFSNLNNLNDISLDPEYATICGYTDNDLRTVFEPELAGLQEEERQEIQRWYNGYHWRGEDKVYNPFDIMLYFQKREFKPYWYETGTPSYLYHLMKRGELSTRELQNLEMYEGDLSTFDLEKVNLNALLFQCGYLTIIGETTRAGESFYTLDYPNREVRLSLNRQLLAVASDTSATEVLKQGETLTRLLADNDFTELQEELKALFAGMPHAWHDHNDMARYEGHYASVLYASFNALNLDIRAEDASVQGRADIVVVYQDQVFIFELKVANGVEVEAKAEQALEQMRDRDYAGKYRKDGKRIHLLAVVFDREKRNLAMLRVEGA